MKKQIAGALLGLTILGTALPTQNVEAAGSKHKLTSTEQKALFFSDLVYEVPKEESKDVSDMGIQKSKSYSDFRKEISENLPKGMSFTSFYDKAGLKNYRMMDLVRQTDKYPQLDDKIKGTGVVVRAFYDKTGKSPTFMAIKGTSNGWDVIEDLEILNHRQITNFYNKKSFNQLHAIATLYVLNDDAMKKKSKQPIILTGHSLGGRNANFFGMVAKIKAITFAAPQYRYNDASEVRKFVKKQQKSYSYKKNITNFQHDRDSITWLPPVPLVDIDYIPGTTYTYSDGFKKPVSMKYHQIKSYYKRVPYKK